MNRKTVLYELMAENTRYIYGILDDAPQAMLHWTTPGMDNSIAVLIWHVARACDVFLTQNAQGLAAAEEAWFAGGWAAKTGYDPGGIGTNGWGQITGYTLAEVQAIPQFEAADLHAYLDQVLTNVRAFLEATPDDQLDEKAPGYEGRQTYWFWVRHPLFDMARHIGEMLALKALWNAR